MSLPVYLSLGSNIRPEEYLPQAVAALQRVGHVVAVSRVWQSPAIGHPDQPDYCNLAVLLETEVPAEVLVDEAGPLRAIEAALGRVRDPQRRGAPRTIDIDVTLLGSDERLVGRKRIPDPDLFDRACIAGPLSELPDVRLPATCGESLSDLAARLLARQPLQPRPDIDAAIRDLLLAVAN